MKTAFRAEKIKFESFHVGFLYDSHLENWEPDQDQVLATYEVTLLIGWFSLSAFLGVKQWHMEELKIVKIIWFIPDKIFFRRLR